jgi:hypothetical protein
VIRRGFWLLTGAALGVTGYRRAVRLARIVIPEGRGGAAGRRQPVPAGRVVLRPPQLTGRRMLAGAAMAGRGAAEGAAFVRDVRDGMAEYLDRQHGQARRSLESQQDRPGGSTPAP